jgi:hypothetical protein
VLPDLAVRVAAEEPIADAAPADCGAISSRGRASIVRSAIIPATKMTSISAKPSARPRLRGRLAERCSRYGNSFGETIAEVVPVAAEVVPVVKNDKLFIFNNLLEPISA